MRSKVLEGALAIGRQADTLGVDEARTRLEKVQSRASQRRADHRDGQVARLRLRLLPACTVSPSGWGPASNGRTSEPPAICGREGEKPSFRSRLVTISRARQKASSKVREPRRARLKKASPKYVQVAPS